MRLTLRPTAMLALGALSLGSIGLVSVAAIPAAADDGDGTVVLSENFEDRTIGALWGSGFSGFEDENFVEDPDDPGNTVLRMNDREQNYFSVSTPGDGFLTVGHEYSVSVALRLANDEDSPASVRLTNNSDYQNLDGANSGASITADEWTTLEGTYVPADADTTLYPEAPANVDILVDDFVVTDLGAVEVEEPGICEPEVVTHTSIDFEDGTTGSWVANDAATLNVTEADGNHVLEISNRGDIHFGIQSPEGAYEPGVEYTFSADVLLPEDAEVRFVAFDEASANTYNWLSGSAVPAGELTTVSGSYTFEAADIATAKAYLQVHNEEDYVVDNILVTYLEPCGDGPEPGSVAISTDFEDGLDGWHLRDSGWDEDDEGGPLPGTPSAEVSTDYAVSGDYSAKVSDRNSQGDGIRFEITDELHPLTQYDITASVRFAEGEPAGDLWFSRQVGESSFTTQTQFTNVTNSGWTEIAGTFTMPSLSDGQQAWIYFETAWDGGAKGNTSTFYIDDIQVSVQEPPVLQDLPPLHSAMNIPVGVAVDNRDTTGVAGDFVLNHFNQITAENFMKPEAWYNSAGEWAPDAGQIDPLMDFAKENDIGVYGHVLVWHSQTPASFFQNADGSTLTNSAADQAILRGRMEEHIDNVAEYLSQWGEFGDDNPLVAFDVVNEVIDDSSNYADGMRRSQWYNILGEEFVDYAFQYADDAFNGTYAADSADRPIVLFINDYNTEFDGKRGRYLSLVDRLIDRGAPIDGIGHQFHLNLSVPVANLEQTILDSRERGLIQAVTELDIETGTPESEAKFVEQGYFYRDAFETFRQYEDELFSVTVWGPIDARSWRDSRGGPLVFDDDYSAKPAYYGIMNGIGGVDLLPPRILTANAFAGSVSADAAGVDSDVWDRLPLLPTDGPAEFQLRWATDHLTVYVEVDDSTATGNDGLTFVLGDETYALDRDGSGDVDGHVTETGSGYNAVAHLPLTASEGDTIEFDIRVSDNGSDAGWNTPGATGTVSLVEELSYIEIPQADEAPTIDGVRDAMWDDAAVASTLKEVEGSGGAIGEFHTLWQDHMLYIYAEIEDDAVDVTGSDPWTQDSVEIYVDGGNHKNGSYRYDDTQIRVSADNAVSVGAGDEGYQLARVESATSEIDGGWAVEIAISLIESGGEGTFQGVDFQVNDAANGSRQSIRNWADPSGVGYQSTARWGVAKLVDTVVTDPGDGEPGDGEPGDGDTPGDGGDVITALPEDEVQDQDKGGIVVPDTAYAGDTITILVGTEHSGVATQTFLYSEPQLIGQSIVDADGNIRVTIPADTTPGTHTIAVYDADGNLLGWDTIEILAADGSLPVTGADGFILPLSIGLLLVLIGVGLVVRRQFAGDLD